MILIFLAALTSRIILAFYGTLQNDLNSWLGWAHRLATVPFSQFYLSWSDYLPGYLYILAILGRIPSSSILLYKLPAIIGDLLAGLLIWRVGKYLKIKPARIFLCLTLFLFNPAIIGTSTLWGQIDILPSLLATISVFLAWVSQPVLSGIILGLGLSIKPTAITGAMAILALSIYLRRWKRLFLTALISAITFIFTFIPFANKPLLPFILDRLQSSAGQYPYASVNAFNLWTLLGRNWIGDSPYIILGIALFVISSLLATFLVFEQKITLPKIFLLQAFYSLAFFSFTTRIHERHLLPVFLPLALAILESPGLIISYSLISILYSLNLSYSYIWITQQFRQLISFPAQAIVSLGLVSNLLLLIIPIRMPKINIKHLLPFILVGFLTLSRLYRLNYPPYHYFDEVYHAFTAQEMLKGNRAAWEWWNTPPAGFAYEWTHPPLAKFGMVLGMKLVGESALGWRLPGAILGILSGILIYAISYKLFSNRTTSLIALFLYTFDGLPLVISRIGMNDIYLVFFLLSTFYLLVSKRSFLASIAFGLALASKWSAVYFLPVFIYYVWRTPYYLLVPPFVYLFTYLPFFSSGHSWSQFIELQKQIWWYHTRLHATHSYSSPAISWPIMYRPVWAFVEYLKSSTSNIYIQGNPVIW